MPDPFHNLTHRTRAEEPFLLKLAKTTSKLGPQHLAPASCPPRFSHVPPTNLARIVLLIPPRPPNAESATIGLAT
jgi:hypothetical protein